MPRKANGRGMGWRSGLKDPGLEALREELRSLGRDPSNMAEKDLKYHIRQEKLRQKSSAETTQADGPGKGWRKGKHNPELVALREEFRALGGDPQPNISGKDLKYHVRQKRKHACVDAASNPKCCDDSDEDRPITSLVESTQDFCAISSASASHSNVEPCAPHAMSVELSLLDPLKHFLPEGGESAGVKDLFADGEESDLSEDAFEGALDLACAFALQAGRCHTFADQHAGNWAS